MKKIIQIIEGKTITALTEDGKVYHRFTYYDNGKEKVFAITKEEEKEYTKKREWVDIEDCHELGFYSEAKREEIEEEEKALQGEVVHQTADDKLQENQKDNL